MSLVRFVSCPKMESAFFPGSSFHSLVFKIHNFPREFVTFPWGILDASWFDSHNRRLHFKTLEETWAQVKFTAMPSFIRFSVGPLILDISMCCTAVASGGFPTSLDPDIILASFIACLCLSPGREAFKRREGRDLGRPCRVTEHDVCYSTQKSRYRFDGKAFVWPVGLAWLNDWLGDHSVYHFLPGITEQFDKVSKRC